MFPLTYDPLDGFEGVYGNEHVILEGVTVPLGQFVVDVLNLDEQIIDEVGMSARGIQRQVIRCLEERDRDGLLEELERVWPLLDRLPAYHECVSRHRLSGDIDEGTVTALFDERSEEYQDLMAWLRKLEWLSFDVRHFREVVLELVEKHFSRVETRTASEYAKIWNGYQLQLSLESQVAADEITDLEGEARERQRRTIRAEMERRTLPTSFSIGVSYEAVPDPKRPEQMILAERVRFHDWKTFLCLDLVRGFAAGHIPRRCEHCGRFFLLDSGYDIRYCEKEAPDAPGKTCRQVGAHKREREQIGSNDVRRAYTTAYNRLKMRKVRGTLTVDEWNRQVTELQDLRDAGYRGEIKLAELEKRFRLY